MEESEYKTTYREIARVRCHFEKALTNNKASCACSKHFWLADREGYACGSKELSAKCREFLENMRESSRFILKLKQSGQDLPHNMEIRVQVGGLIGVQALLTNESRDTVENIHELLHLAEAEYGSYDKLPYDRIVQSVSRYQGRKSRKRG